MAFSSSPTSFVTTPTWSLVFAYLPHKQCFGGAATLDESRASGCWRPSIESIGRSGPAYKINSMKIKLTIGGLLIGSVVGFLVQPSVPLIGQLPFSTVITRGGNLRGLDQLMLGYARSPLQLFDRRNGCGNYCRIDCGVCSFQKNPKHAFSGGRRDVSARKYSSES